MNIGFELKLTQEQKLVMTMEMQQSIKLLQMSSYELLNHIDKEIQENVLLDYENPTGDNREYEQEKGLKDYKELIKYLDEDFYENRSYYRDEKNENLSPLNFISDKPTLKDYLKDQIVYSNLSKEDELYCKYIVDNIDSRGYLDANIIDILEVELKISKDRAQYCLEQVQTLEPVGIGARTLEECLILQIDRREMYDINLENIINNYLYELSLGKYKQIGKELKLSPKEVQQYEDEIKTLEPKPSRGFFTGEEIGYLVPDVYIKKIDNEYIVIPNDNLLPHLTINNTYKKVLKSSEDEKTISYVKDKIDSAMFLIKSIENRKSTVCKVVEEIVKYQRGYLDGDEKVLRPMTIKSIAKTIGMHESTVSRAVRDKYVALHNGNIKNIREFFCNSINEANEDLSCEKVKLMIKSITDSEDKTKPYSDSTICNELNSKGIDISRRTIAKYREELGIKSSTQRKRLT